MSLTLADRNKTRAARGEVQIQASFGLHFGQVVLGDIRAHRLEFAVIGKTVNIASRVEALTRTLKCEIAITDHLRTRVIAEIDGSETDLNAFSRQEPQSIRAWKSP